MRVWVPSSCGGGPHVLRLAVRLRLESGVGGPGGASMEWWWVRGVEVSWDPERRLGGGGSE